MQDGDEREWQAGCILCKCKITNRLFHLPMSYLHYLPQAGKVVANSDSLEPYQTISAEQFMKCISNNTLSYALHLSLALTIIFKMLFFRCFLALKHAADAMAKADESAGKLTGGGSIILTSSSMLK